MATLPNSKLVTYEEWLRMPEVTDAIEEVVDGEIIMMPPAKAPHAYLIENLLTALKQQLTDRRFRILTGSFGLVIRTFPLTSRTPDLAIFDEANAIVRDGYFHSAPELAIEVLSPSNTRRDLQRKLADYSSVTVPEVWVFSPEARTVEVLLLNDGLLQTDRVLPESGVLTPSHFPEIRLDLASVWPD
jgi:Uma2 family endonuclease